MYSVTERIRRIKQPWGGYIRPSLFEVIDLNDGTTLNEEENIHASVVGMVVDYLTRYSMSSDRIESFSISLKGAIIAERLGKTGSIDAAITQLCSIQGLDDYSIVNACKLVTFDVWFRNTLSAMACKDYQEINPDKATVENIRVLVQRSLSFFNQYGKIIKSGFSFEPVITDEKKYMEMILTGEGTYGGYTATVSCGDGDYLTKDTMWDIKVSRSRITSKHTLQLLMYWIMGQYSGQEVFKFISRVGIFNPRLNKAYILDVNKISDEAIKTVEREVICYK